MLKCEERLFELNYKKSEGTFKACTVKSNQFSADSFFVKDKLKVLHHLHTHIRCAPLNLRPGAVSDIQFVLNPDNSREIRLENCFDRLRF